MRTRGGHDGPEYHPGDAPAVAPTQRQTPGDPAASLLAIAWAAFQPRTVQLATELGGESVFVSSPRLARSTALLPLRYVSSALRTWGLLERHRPRRVLVITPPVVAPLVCLLWCTLRGRDLAVDCHTGAFHSHRWAWARPLHRWVLRRSPAVLVHTDEALELVRAWGAAGLLVPDDLPEPEEAAARSAAEQATVLVAGSLDENEPVSLVLEAARLLPEVQVRLTGDPDLLEPDVRRAAPANAVFTGFLPYREFLGELLAADVVAAFSTDPQIMNRAAFEAVGLGRPLVLSELPALRARFGEAAVFAPNRPPDMAEALRGALAKRAELARRSTALAVELREQRRRALDQLRLRLEGARAVAAEAPEARAGLRSARPRGAVLLISQHSFAEEAIVRRNVFELLDAGYDVDLICSTGVSGVRRAGGRPGLHVHWVPIRHRRRPLLRYAWEYAAFFAAALAVAGGLASRRRYAAVQVDNLPDFLVFAALPARLRGARVVFNMFELTPEMVASRFGPGAARVLGGFSRRLERAATGWADQVIVVSEECRRRVLQRGVSPEKVSVVLNTTATPPGEAAGTASGRAGASERPYVVTHTTLVERYGVRLVIQAFASLQRRWPELTLRVIGDGEERPVLERQAADLGLAERVVFTGFLPWTETMGQVRRALVGIVAVMADGYGEVLLPTKLLEYARFGVPAVCSRLPVIEHYFPADSVAYFPAGDASQLAAQMDLLLSDPVRSREQAERAQEVARRLGWEQVRGEYLKALGLVGTADQPMALTGSWEERPA
jgi:glycosyltransferase involved in cell wall biosynthesis